MNSPFFSRIHFNENLTAFGELLAAEPMQISIKKLYLFRFEHHFNGIVCACRVNSTRIWANEFMTIRRNVLVHTSWVLMVNKDGCILDAVDC